MFRFIRYPGKPAAPRGNDASGAQTGSGPADHHSWLANPAPTFAFAFGAGLSAGPVVKSFLGAAKVDFSRFASSEVALALERASFEFLSGMIDLDGKPAARCLIAAEIPALSILTGVPSAPENWQVAYSLTTPDVLAADAAWTSEPPVMSALATRVGFVSAETAIKPPVDGFAFRVMMIDAVASDEIAAARRLFVSGPIQNPAPDRTKQSNGSHLERVEACRFLLTSRARILDSNGVTVIRGYATGLRSTDLRPGCFVDTLITCRGLPEKRSAKAFAFTSGLPKANPAPARASRRAGSIPTVEPRRFQF